MNEILNYFKDFINNSSENELLSVKCEILSS